MKILFVINDAPYGTEKAFNAFRLASQILKDKPNAEVRIFLLADAVNCSLKNQITPQGYYNIERMIRWILSKGGKVMLCGTCSDARGLKELNLIDGVQMSNLAEFSEWTIDSDKVLTF